MVERLSGAPPGARPRRPDRPPGLGRLRIVLLALCLIAGTGLGGHAPLWTRLVLAVTSAVVPAAVAFQHGRAAVRALLGLPARPGRVVPTTVRS